MRRVVVRRWAVGLLGLAMAGGAVAGCAYQEGLVPAPSAAVVPGSPRVAYDKGGQVGLWVDGDAWRGYPRDLESVMTPIWVTIQNRGQQPVRVMYKDLALEYPSGMQVNPLPPFQMRTVGPTRYEPIRVSSFDYYGFYPSYGWYYPGLSPWYGSMANDSFFLDTYYARWPVPLPTEDMLRGALPEGVLQPGGAVSGFVYFADVPKKASGVFTFRARLPHEPDDKSVAAVDVPLVPR
jgi:hypothetical protein